MIRYRREEKMSKPLCGEPDRSVDTSALSYSSFFKLACQTRMSLKITASAAHLRPPTNVHPLSKTGHPSDTETSLNR
jgi:hypothetical protein